eukprot:m.79529 g.79529  ORF g.79529 m.79529 type:complete len:373 (-) comp25223_c0_seq1:151-1269(-)
MMKSGFVFVAIIAVVAGHGAIISPRSRNSIDYLVGVNSPADWPSNAECTNITGDKCFNGQADFWYSQGCFIGCPVCDHMSGRRQIDLCGLGKQATINDPKYRSVNRNATAGSPEDIYKHNPWRAPGSAPVGDACGLAGGTPWLPEVGEAGDYQKTIYAHHGMNGTTLPPMDTGVEWTIGLEAEVTWQVENNHGGGYSYRLCPADEKLTEACFQSHQLDFVTDQQGIVFQNGTVLPIEGTFISNGTYPEGSMWSMIPIPTNALGPRCIAGPNDTATTPNGCQPWESKLVGGPCIPCPQTAGSDCSRCDNNWNGVNSFTPPCDGCSGSTHTHAIRDVVKVPTDLAPGKYVLGWRYDCEATAQVWSNCADITLVR